MESIYYTKKDLPDLYKQLERAKKRLKDLQKRGDEACSKYDLMMGYNAHFYLNVCTLPANHISFLEKQIKLVKGNQLSLF